MGYTRSCGRSHKTVETDFIKQTHTHIYKHDKISQHTKCHTYVLQMWQSITQTSRMRHIMHVPVLLSAGYWIAIFIEVHISPALIIRGRFIVI